ncbi:MAG TPA: aromatic prenyltransferase [Phototrophicaceae bacterium]|nr:aromatic prenyltransferase [Phototrophicaceae bacterium]
MAQDLTPRLDLQRLYQDTEKYAAITEVPFNGTVVRQFLDAYQELYATSAIALRTTTKAPGKRELSLRYINHGHPHDPYQIALERGFLREAGHPIENLVTEVQERIPLLGFGVDVGVSHGLEKIWPLFSVGVPLAKLYELPSMPAAIATYDAYFKKYGLEAVTLLALDYMNKSVNLYFPINKEPGSCTIDIAAGIIGDLGFKVPPPEELELNTRGGILYHTFTWDSPRCERVSFGVAHAPMHEFPVHLHPLFQRLYDEAPVVSQEARASLGTAYLPNHSDYLKFEMDYTGTMLNMLGASIFVPLMN